MQPQMPFFLGREAPPAPLTTTAQKVFRTPDIDEVGLDTYHLTFFEMLGNFSFGQYFKEGAIEYATEFIRERLGLDWDRVWVTIHAGDPDLKLGPDQEAIDLWEKIGMPPERIVPLPSSENFWSVGGPGPCGPDSEIYWDWGVEIGCAGGCLPGCSNCERFLEFWNLVFMAYELHPDNTLTPLPKQNIDTGMGLERTARILQNVASVYDTDGYQQIMAWIAETSGVAYGDSVDATKAHRVLADHGRGMTFLDWRGDHAVERGPRLRAPPGDPPCDPARSADRDAGALHRRPVGDGDRPDGRRVSRARRASRPDRAGPLRGGGALLRDARARDEALRGGGGTRSDLGRGRVRAPGHLRLPDRAHRRARARARDRGRRGRVRAPDGGPQRDLAGRRRQGRAPAGGRFRARGRLRDGVRRLGEAPRC